MPLTLHITWKFPPDQVSAFYDALRPLQEKLVQEKECLCFNIYEVGQDSGVVRLVEIWDCDMKWMANVQSKKEYYQPFYETAKKIALEPQKVEVLKGVDGFRFTRS